MNKERHGTRLFRKTALRSGVKVAEVALALYYSLRDPQTPVYARALIVIGIIYFLSPIDLIPDFIPGVGFVDDFGILTLVALLATGSMTPSHFKQGKEKLEFWLQK